MEIDFNEPDKHIEELRSITDGVEKECPVGQALKKYMADEVKDPRSLGEGVVWSAIWKGELLSFKVKGEKHSESPVKVLKPVDMEKAALVHDFVTRYACTPSRLQQQFDEVMDTLNGGIPTIKKTGPFLKAMVTDTMQECHHELAEMGLEVKDVTKSISQTGRVWLMERV